MANILVFAQTDGTGIHDVSLQCVVKARALADAGGGAVTAIALGSGIADAAKGLFGYGADTVVAADDASLANFLTGPYKAVIQAHLAGASYDAFLLPSTTSGDDLAPILAAEANAACVIGGSDVVIKDGKVAVTRMQFDRKVFTSFGAKDGAMLIATMKDGLADSGAADATKSGEVTALEIPDTAKNPASSVTNRDVVGKTVNLKDAAIIVGAGAGVGTQDNFQKIRDLATALGAEIGATRAVVDAGWLPADHQIGQTGATARPDVYIACGISGAVQHWVGISEAKKIISINTDANSPMMKKAHYRIAGDLNAVIPKLLGLLG